MRRRHRHPIHGRLFWRIYLGGLLLLGLVALGLAVAGWATRDGAPPGRPERLAELAARQVAEDLGDAGRLARSLARAREDFGVQVSVYREGRLLASSASPPLRPLPPDEEHRLRGGPMHLRGHGWTFAAPVPGHPGAYLILGGWRPFSSGRAALLVGAVLACVALVTIPLARSIAAPLERLSAAARRLGSGDLTARAGFGGRGEVGELARAFDEMAVRVEGLVRAERELLANVSHELRTPLARMRVALDLAAEGDQAAARRHLAGIGADLAELEKLVEDVLAAARAEGGAGALPLRRERVAPAEVLERAAARFRERTPGRALALRLGEGLPALEADPALLRRAVDNLLDNAAKYSDPPAPVELAAAAEGRGLRIEVRDRGIGVEPADLPRLFTPFFRTDRSRARGTGGVGLGLALVRRIAEAHGGTAGVESAPGQGTTAWLRLPGAP